MNIIQARKAAEEGKTVISPCGRIQITGNTFSEYTKWDPDDVFGEWTLKPEPRKPVVFDSFVRAKGLYGEIEHADCRRADLVELIGKRVKVTVEVVDDAE
jgi:hypothetical protein